MQNVSTKIILSIPLAVVLVGGLVFYGLGYRIGEGFSILSAGSLSIENVREGAQVYLDNKKKESGAGSLSLDRVPAGEHTLLVAKEAYWPWAKDIALGSAEHVEINPFLIPRETSGEVILEGDAQYQAILAQIAKAGKAIPTRESKKISKDENVAIWWEEGALVASWIGTDKSIPGYFCSTGVCEKELVVFIPEEGLVRGLDFYKGRNDVIVFSIENGIFAIELDGRGTRNFQPIYKGTQPEFVLTESGDMYVKDNEFLFLVRL